MIPRFVRLVPKFTVGDVNFYLGVVLAELECIRNYMEEDLRVNRPIGIDFIWHLIHYFQRHAHSFLLSKLLKRLQKLHQQL